MGIHHGVVSRQELISAGLTHAEIKEHVAAGRYRRIRRDWFATSTAPLALVQAVQLGGRLGCISGAIVHGLWVPPWPGHHVLLNPGTPVPEDSQATYHRLATPCRSALAPVGDCVEQILRWHGLEPGLVALESAVESGSITVAQADRIIRRCPHRLRRRLHHFRIGAGSGSETRVRLFLQQRNHHVRAQVHILGIGRVDLLVGESLILECDSHSYHSTPEQQIEDRRRDMRARELGYTTVRLSYQQIWSEWEQTQTFLINLLATRVHRRPLRPLLHMDSRPA